MWLYLYFSGPSWWLAVRQCSDICSCPPKRCPRRCPKLTPAQVLLTRVIRSAAQSNRSAAVAPSPPPVGSDLSVATESWEERSQPETTTARRARRWGSGLRRRFGRRSSVDSMWTPSFAHAGSVTTKVRNTASLHSRLPGKLKIRAALNGKAAMEQGVSAGGAPGSSTEPGFPRGERGSACSELRSVRPPQGEWSARTG